MRINLRQQVSKFRSLPFSEKRDILGKCFLFMGMLDLFFYRNVWAFPLMFLPGAYFFYEEVEKKRRKAKESLAEQFKDCILSVATSLRAGYAVENAFLESMEDMRLLYGEQSEIFAELERIRRGLIINISLEELLADFAERRDIEDIEQFANVFAIAKRIGGNLSQIIQNTAELIGQRMETKKELQTILQGRWLEQTIMRWMPFGILAYIRIGYPHYLDGLYHNLSGAIFMTACLALYMVAYHLSEVIWNRIFEELV